MLTAEQPLIANNYDTMSKNIIFSFKFLGSLSCSVSLFFYCAGNTLEYEVVFGIISMGFAIFWFLNDMFGRNLSKVCYLGIFYLFYFSTGICAVNVIKENIDNFYVRVAMSLQLYTFLAGFFARETYTIFSEED